MYKKICAYLNPKELRGAADFCRRQNSRELWFILNASLLPCLLNVGAQTFFEKSVTYPSAILLLVIITTCYIVTLARFRDPMFDPRIAIYVMGFSIAATAVLGDTLFNPGTYAFSAFIYIAMISVLITDVPWRILVFDIALGLLFISVDVPRKKGLVLEIDLIRCIGVTAVAAVLSMTRVHRVLHLLNMNTNIQDLAEHDPLTSVYNRAGGEMLIKDHIRNERPGTMVILDIDNFKHVNDTYGHQTGDRVLKELGAHLLESFRSTDVVMRLGGDEFVIYAVGMVDRSSVDVKMDEVCKGAHKIMLDQKDGEHLTISMGCVINDGSYPTLDILYHTSDGVLYKTKKAGKDGYKILGVSYKGNVESTPAPEKSAE